VKYTTLQDLFRNYDTSYIPYIEAMQRLELLEKDNGYCPTDAAKAKGYERGWTKSYRVTEKAIELLCQSETEYLKKLMTDKKEKRKIQKSISKRKVWKKDYGDYVLNYIYDGLINTSFDYSKAMDIMDSLEIDKKAKTNCVSHLICFAKKDFKELKNNNTDNRIWNNYAAIKSELRQCSNYKGMTRQFVIDIRACHPTFFSSYILKLLNDALKLSTTNLFTTYCHTERRQLELEHRRWIKQFTDIKTDPRNIIMNQCGYDNIETTKKALNETLNGSLSYKKCLQWLEQEYPCLYQAWQMTDIKRTGCNISKMFEGCITMNPDLYKEFDNVGIKAMYEYDGFSIYGMTEDNLLESKCNFIKGKMTEISNRLFNLPIVIKIKAV
jgi:hypothetical protein